MSDDQSQDHPLSANPVNPEASTTSPADASALSISYLLDASWATFKNIWLALLKVQLAGVLIGILASAAALIVATIIASFLAPMQAAHSTLTVILIVVGILLFFVGALLLGSWIQLKQLHILAAKEEALWTFNWPAIWGLVGVTLLTTLVIIGGFILLIIPGILFAVWLSQSQYVYVFEGIGGKAALSRSKQYVSGRWWPVFGRLILPSLAVYALSALATALTSMLRILVGSASAEILGTIIQIFINTGGSLFILCYSYHLYLGLKTTAPQNYETVSVQNPQPATHEQ